MDNFIEEQRVDTVQVNQETDTVESSLDKKLDGFQSRIDQKLDILQESISKLAQQLDHQGEENPEDECLTETVLGEQAQLQPQEELKVESVEAPPEELQDAPKLGIVYGPWKKEEETSPMLTEEGSETKVVEVPKKNVLQPIPIELNPTSTAQDTKCPLPVAPSTDQVYILPPPAPQPTNEAPTTKAILALPPLKSLKKIVVIVRAFATTSKTMAAAHIAWHSGWFGCRFGFGAPGHRHF